ncbi:MAG: hypothetical protein K0R47_5962 [Brevibacillus sp.]|jgi:hypothetical protein|nr:hypothetical protein [Brevibacillus sp.]
MREIKFRAWHAGHEYAEPQMIYDVRPGDCLVWKSQGQNITEIMQYTGMKDIDGKEIYENDIFTVNKSMGEIIYEEDRFRIRWIYNPNEYNEILRNIVHYVGIAVIGNRLSNPEILEAN